MAAKLNTKPKIQAITTRINDFHWPIPGDQELMSNIYIEIYAKPASLTICKRDVRGKGREIWREGTSPSLELLYIYYIILYYIILYYIILYYIILYYIILYYIILYYIILYYIILYYIYIIVTSVRICNN